MVRKITVGLGLIIALSMVGAQPKVIDRTQEAKDYPDLQATEKSQEANIQDAYKRMGSYAPLVNMASRDRAMAFKEKQEPLKFENTFRFVKFTPRNTYVRYVKESPDFLFVGLGDSKTITDLINEKTAQAQAAGVKDATPLALQQRDGIELTQFQFILRQDADKTRAIGSRRKTLMLFYKPGSAAPDTQGTSQLDLVVTRVVEDNYDAGVKYVELIIDPSPSTPGMDDVVTLNRYNYKVTTCALVGTYSNTPNYPHRVEFKQKFFLRLLDHFDTLYGMVDRYAKRDGNDINEKAIVRMQNSLDY